MGKGAGKGRGRGGCGALEAVGDCVQCIAATICLICIAGPVLTIVGISFITSAFMDDRAEKIDEFKLAVGNWMDGAVDGFASTTNDWSYTIDNSCGTSVPDTSLTLSSSPEDLGSESDETGDFAGYQIVKFEDANPPSASQTLTAQQATCNLEISISFQDDVIGNITEPVVTQRSLSFTQTGCSQTQQTSNRRQSFEQQDVSSCESTCRSSGGEASGTTYNTFQCDILESPSAICVRVANSGDTWTLASGTLPDRPTGASGPGCILPFDISALSSGGGGWEQVETSAVSGTGSLQIPIEVRSERDPYLYFLDISDGSKSFGLTTGEKLQIGFSLLAIGLLLTTCVCFCCCGIVKFARGIASGKRNRPENPVGGAMYDVAGKYGGYIPGGAALGQPVPGQTVAGAPAGKPPTGYPGGGAGYGGTHNYDGGTSYDSPNVQYGAHGGGGGYQGAGGNPYGGATNNAPWAAGTTANQYGTSAPAYPTGVNAGAPPAGYPTAV